jgi:DNA-binding transcriptional LysR family regulator
MLDWNDLRTFAEVARRGTVAAAATFLGLHATTVARRIAAAEAALGSPLFLRSGRRLQVSPTGRALLQTLDPLVDVIDDVARRARVGDHMPLRVAATEHGGRVLTQYSATELWNDGIEVEILADNATADLARGDADLALRVVAPDAAELVRRRISAVTYGLFASAEYLRRAPAFADGWPGHQVVVPSGLLSAGPEARFLAEKATRAIVTLRSNSHVSLALAAETGMGLVVLPQNLAVFHRQLVRVRRLPEIPERPLWLVWHRSQHANKRLRRASQIIARTLASLEASLLRDDTPRGTP